MVKPIRTFTVSPSLPPELERQRSLVYNLRWAWNHDAIELFRWDRDLWEQSGHNPALMLGTIDQGTLLAAASDEGFLARLNRVSNDFDAYQKSESTWFRKHHDGTTNLLVAYFSAEFGVTDCLSIFAGGLGILAGDHLKSASDLGVPLVAVGLLYQQGYFRQYLNEAGWQQEEYRDNDFHNLPLTLERYRDGEHMVHHMREEDAILFRLAEELLDEAVKASLTQSFAQEEAQSSDGMVARYERLAQELEKNWAV